MRRLDLPRRRVLPSRWAMLVLLGCIVASVFITLNADAGLKGGMPASAAAADKAPSKPATPPSQEVSVPPKPEESATIQDDPTIAPDPKESADNNIAFPVDI
jgi:hypothetical protein